MSEQHENTSSGSGDSKKQELLVVAGSLDDFGGSFLGDTSQWKYTLCTDLSVAFSRMNADQGFDAMVVSKSFFAKFLEKQRSPLEKIIVDNNPTAIILVDSDQKIIWYNRQFQAWSYTNELLGLKFYVPLGRPDLLGPDYCPFRSVRIHRKPSLTTLYQKADNRYLEMLTAPVYNESGEITSFVVQIRDITQQKIRDNKLEQLRKAGKALYEISTDDILNLSQGERTSILRTKITKYVREILQFDTIEIRIFSDKIPLLLEPLLAIGMTDEAKQRVLYAYQENNGITGWVAYHGRSYMMENATEDRFYIQGMPGAQSSITVPLLHHGKVIGTFNVESQKTKAFDDYDLKLLEAFAEAVAQAIHTLDLLNAEHDDAAFESLETVYNDVVKPINNILNECARLQRSILDGTLDSAEDFCAALGYIQKQTREIQTAFQEHGAEIAPTLKPEISATDCGNYPMLRGTRILLADGDPSVSEELSRMLFYYGCTVESATTGENALKMLETGRYDLFFSDIKLPDMSAFAYFKQVRCALCREANHMPPEEACSPPEESPVCEKSGSLFVPFIYMRSFGYDTGHVSTKAREAGVIGFIYKPFILSQLLETMKKVLQVSLEQRHNPPPKKETGV